MAHAIQTYRKNSPFTLSSVTELIAYGQTEPGKATDVSKMSRRGYEFTGWKGSDLSTPSLAEVSSFDNAQEGLVLGFEDLFLSAQWQAITYDILYTSEASSHVNPATGNTYTYRGDEIWYSTKQYTIQPTPILIDQIPEDDWKPGYHIWLSNLTQPDSPWSIKANTIGTIQINGYWELCSYNITYNLKGGINNPANPSTYTIEDSTITLQEPKYDGYTFNGWLSAGTSTKITKIEAGSYGNIGLEATWTADDFEMSFAHNPLGAGTLSAIDTSGNKYYNDDTPTLSYKTALTATVTNNKGYEYTQVVMVDAEKLKTIGEGWGPGEPIEFLVPSCNFIISAIYSDVEGQVHFNPGYY